MRKITKLKLYTYNRKKAGKQTYAIDKKGNRVNVYSTLLSHNCLGYTIAGSTLILELLHNDDTNGKNIANYLFTLPDEDFDITKFVDTATDHWVSSIASTINFLMTIEDIDISVSIMKPVIDEEKSKFLLDLIRNFRHVFEFNMMCDVNVALNRFNNPEYRTRDIKKLKVLSSILVQVRTKYKDHYPVNDMYVLLESILNKAITEIN